MQEDTAALNDRWAALLIDLLVQQKVDYFCLSPGSRCTPLAIALANHPKAKTFVHFDERGAAFHALGYAKATGKPAAIISTSGTAAGNLFPAVMEAALSHTTLIVITADRPPELRDVSANQTVDQVKLFGTYARFAVDLPPPSHAISDVYLATLVAQSVFISLQPPHGPVHLNCMYREPLFSTEPLILSSQPVLNYETSSLQPSEEQLQRWAENLSQYEKGIILVGNLPHTMEKESLLALSKKLGWPLLPDIFSGLRTHTDAIGNHDLILKGIPEMPLEVVLHLGDRILSKTLSEWMKKTAPKRYFQVIDHPLRSDPAHQVTDRLLCAPDTFCTRLLPLIAKKESWLEEWQHHNQTVKEALEDCFDSNAPISEPSLFFFLQTKWPLFLANSMPVRDAHFFLTTQE
ncbi:MAG TPA: 2-succinyl-5-enolpyruvyl-6-hydroxy-3-cyclohexene-1-carboxylic-acid synthase, partial [Rhabdochlamydiaceae bacterium]|nr:2-succinyl-5-enolpyruvyl-6-hydroxy-3-cyclohexene-1-carboxylic-acid synthase [Rhabdochlamydiaceae bacterium]